MKIFKKLFARPEKVHKFYLNDNIFYLNQALALRANYLLKTFSPFVLIYFAHLVSEQTVETFDEPFDKVGDRV